MEIKTTQIWEVHREKGFVLILYKISTKEYEKILASRDRRIKELCLTNYEKVKQ